jgi:hypothetical protein
MAPAATAALTRTCGIPDFNAALALGHRPACSAWLRAIQSMRFHLWNTLKDVIGAVSGGSGAVRFRKALVVAQVAFSFLLLAGAGLLCGRSPTCCR